MDHSEQGGATGIRAPRAGSQPVLARRTDELHFLREALLGLLLLLVFATSVGLGVGWLLAIGVGLLLP